MDSNFEKDETTSSNHSVNKEMQIPRSSFVKTVNNLNASLLFRLFDVFNHLSTTPPIQQGLAAYISFQDKCPFIDGYVESQFKQEGVHVYVAKEQPLMKVKTDEVKEY